MGDGTEIIDLQLARKGAPLGQLTGRQFGGGSVNGPWSRMSDAKWLGPYTPTWIPHSTRKLMRRDGQIALGLAALKSPFFGIEYRLVGGDPAVRGFLRRVLLETPLFDRLIWSCLNSLDFGFQSHELVWDVGDLAAVPEGGKPADVVKFPDAYYLRKIRDLDPELLEILIDEREELAGIRFGLSGSLTIPADKVLHAVNQEEFGSPLGESILDRAYNPWFFCNVQYLLLNRYLEQRGNPPLIGTAPNEIRYDESIPQSQQTGKHCLDVLNEQMNALRSGGVCAIPFEIDPETKVQKWGIRVLEDGGRTETFLGAINHYNAMKLRSLYVPERIATQDTQTGSFAMVSEHVDVFFSMLEVIKRLTVLRPLQRLIEKIVRANFGRATVVPLIEASELSRFKSQLLGDIVKQILTLPRTAPDGSQFLAADMIDLEKTLEVANVPAKTIGALMDELKKRPPSIPAAPAPPSGESPTVKQELSMSSERGVLALADLLGGRAAKDMNINVSAPIPPAPVVHVHVPEQPAPVVNVAAPIINLPEQPAPIVNVTVPEQSAPVVNVKTAAPIINLPEQPAPVVNVPAQPAPVVHMPERRGMSVTVTRGPDGRINGAEIRPQE